MSTATSITDLTRETFDKTATTVEEIHQSIVGLPFDALERIGVLEEVAVEGKRVSSELIGSVYSLIRDVNGKVTDYVDSFISKSN